MSSTTYDLKNLNRHWRPRPKAFLIFSDLDGTFTPMDLMGKMDFVHVVKEIQTKKKCAVKFIPVSGRPAGYVLRVLHDCRDMLRSEGIRDVCDYGAAESAAMMVNCHKTYDLTYLGHHESKHYKSVVADVLKKSKYSDLVVDEIDKLYTCSIHILQEVKDTMPTSKHIEIYTSIKNDIEAIIGVGKMNFAMSHNTMEIMPSEIKKSEGIIWAFDQYRKDYNVIGLLYAGDAENDKIAMDYVSRLAEIPGINSHNFTPGNSQDAISSWKVEPWKHRNRAAHCHFVEKGCQDRFKGITELIRLSMIRNQLVGTGVRFWETIDDCHPSVLGAKKHPQYRTLQRYRSPSPPPIVLTRRHKAKSVTFDDFI